jgi:hypothetical protein
MKFRARSKLFTDIYMRHYSSYYDDVIRYGQAADGCQGLFFYSSKPLSVDALVKVLRSLKKKRLGLKPSA